MIKNSIALLCILFLFSCSQKKSEDNLDEDHYVEIAYDTTAIDSFSTGAISVDVAEQIRKSSVAYQDSIRQVKIAAEIAKKDLEEKQKLEKLEKEKLEKEKQAAAKKNGEEKVE